MRPKEPEPEEPRFTHFVCTQCAQLVFIDCQSDSRFGIPHPCTPPKDWTLARYQALVYMDPQSRDRRDDLTNYMASRGAKK